MCLVAIYVKNFLVCGIPSLTLVVYIVEKNSVKTKKVNISKDILLGSASVETVDYLYNYISDFLNLSDESIKSYFPEIKVEKVEKSYHKKKVKSEKNRTQTVNVKLPSYVRSGTFQNGRWKRRFFY